MDRVIIIGTYEFIGFHFCQYFLEQGIEVIGIHIPTDDREQFFAEKRLLIGRNANFHEEDETYLSTLCDHSANTVMFMDYYSFYMKREETKLTKAIDMLTKSEENPSIVLLMPIQLYEDAYFFKHHFTFYLPTIYGPWQPSNFSFHQALYCSESSIVLDEREWTEDAIYIGDTIQTIVNHLQNGPKSLLLKSRIKDQWKNIMTLLRKDFTIHRQDDQLSVKEDLIALEVDGIGVREGIERQKSHLSQLNR